MSKCTQQKYWLHGRLHENMYQTEILTTWKHVLNRDTDYMKICTWQKYWIHENMYLTVILTTWKHVLDKYLATSNHVALEEKGLQQQQQQTTTTKGVTRSAATLLALKKIWWNMEVIREPTDPWKCGIDWRKHKDSMENKRNFQGKIAKTEKIHISWLVNPR